MPARKEPHGRRESEEGGKEKGEGNRWVGKVVCPPALASSEASGSWCKMLLVARDVMKFTERCSPVMKCMYNSK